MHITPSIKRRRVLRGMATAGVGVSIAGCEENLRSVVNRNERSCAGKSDFGIDQSKGENLFQRNPNEWYLNVQKYINGLREPWTSDPENFAENYSERLTKLALELIVPGVEDIAPGAATNMAEIAEVSARSFQILNEAWAVTQIQQYLLAWSAKLESRTNVQSEYRNLGIDPNQSNPIKPLFDTVLESFYINSDTKKEIMLGRSTSVVTILQLMELPIRNTEAATLQCPLNQNLMNYERALNLLSTVLKHDLGLMTSTEESGRDSPNVTNDVLYASNRKLGRGGIDKILLNGTVSTVFDSPGVKGLAAAQDGTFWTTEQQPPDKTDHVRNVDMKGNILTEFPSRDEGPRGIAIDHKGVINAENLIYVAAAWSGNINQFDQSGKLLKQFPIPTNRIDDISIDSDGNLWYVVPRTNNVYKTIISNNKVSVVGNWQPDFESISGAASNENLRGLAVKESDVWMTQGAGTKGLFRFSKSGEFQSMTSDIQGRLYLNDPPVEHSDS